MYFIRSQRVKKNLGEVAKYVTVQQKNIYEEDLLVFNYNSLCSFPAVEEIPVKKKLYHI